MWHQARPRMIAHSDSQTITIARTGHSTQGWQLVQPQRSGSGSARGGETHTARDATRAVSRLHRRVTLIICAIFQQQHATCSGDIHHLARIEDVERVEASLDRAHHLHRRLAILRHEVLLLADADAVLARARAACRKRALH